MKKLICLAIVVACMLSLFACGSSALNAHDEIVPSGQEMQINDVREEVANRQSKYLDSDMKAYEKRDAQWFEFALAYVETGVNRYGYPYEEKVTVEGKFGFINGRQSVFEGVFLIEEITKPYAYVGNGETVEEKTIDKTSVILLDGILYLDGERTYVKGEDSSVEAYKMMGELDKLLANDLVDNLQELLLEENSDWDYYGFAVCDLLDYVENGCGELNASSFYSDGSFIYSVVDFKKDGLYGEYPGNFTSRIKFKNKSAIVERFTFKYEYIIDSDIINADIELCFDMKQIASASITAPKLDGYVEL